MNRNTFRIFLILCLVLGPALAPRPLLACAACFGKSDSPLAQGMNMGILSLLVVVVSVLGGIAAFFVFLIKKSAAVAALAAAAPPPGEQPLSPSPK